MIKFILNSKNDNIETSRCNKEGNMNVRCFIIYQKHCKGYFKMNYNYIKGKIKMNTLI